MEHLLRGCQGKVGDWILEMGAKNAVRPVAIDQLPASSLRLTVVAEGVVVA